MNMFRRDAPSNARLGGTASDRSRPEHVLRAAKPMLDALLLYFASFDVSTDDLVESLRKTAASRSKNTVEQVPMERICLQQCSMVLQEWHTAVEYTGPDGNPRALSRTEFRELCAASTRWLRVDEPLLAASKIFRHLKTAGSIEIGAKGITPINRAYMPPKDSSIYTYRLSQRIGALLRTGIHNQKHQNQPCYYERSIYTLTFDPKYLPLFQKYLDQHGTRFLYTADEWLAHRSRAGPDGIVVGASLFMFSDEMNTTDICESDKRTPASNEKIAADPRDTVSETP